MQLLLFKQSFEELMLREMNDLRNQCEKVRKSQFAKISELSKKYNETKHELDTLKSEICRNSNPNHKPMTLFKD